MIENHSNREESLEDEDEFHNLSRGDGFSPYRKIWHMLGLVFPFAFYLDLFSVLNPAIPHASRLIGLSILLFGIFFVFFIDLIRFQDRKLNRLFFKLAGSLLKKTETGRFNATLPYMISNFFLFLFFDYKLVVLGGIFLMIGDPAAAFFGERYGKIRIGKGKSLEGTIGFILASIGAGLVFLFFNHFIMARPGIFSFTPPESSDLWLQIYPLVALMAGAFFASIAELYSPNTLYGLMDDNLLVPIAGATGAAVVLLFFDGVSLENVFFNPLKMVFW